VEFGVLVFVGLLIFGAVSSWLEGSDLTDEDKAEIRRQHIQERHAQRMLDIQAEHQKKQKKSALWHSVGGTAAKVGVGLLVKGLTGHKHHHRH